MTVATPLSLRWERAQHIDRSASKPLGHRDPARKYNAPRAVQPVRTGGLPSG
jgi:hypothetical protein